MTVHRETFSGQSKTVNTHREEANVRREVASIYRINHAARGTPAPPKKKPRLTPGLGFNW
jgi:hypothetical protein